MRVESAAEDTFDTGGVAEAVVWRVYKKCSRL